MSPFEEILLLYNSKDWDWRLVSTNPSVSLEFILEHKELPWVPAYVSCNPSITEAQVKAHLSYPWVLERLCANPNMSIQFFNEFVYRPQEVVRIDWAAISANPGITMLDIIGYPKYNWSDRYLSANPNLTSSYVLNEGKFRNWFVPSVCANPGITERDIYKSSMKTMFEWDFRNLSANPNLPIAFVNANIKQDWNFHTVSSHAKMTDLHYHQKIPWDGHGLSMNPNISFEYVLDHPELSWHAPTLLANHAITFDTYMSNRAWFHKHVPEEEIVACLSANATIPAEFISQKKHSINWKRMSSNRMMVK